MGLAAIWELFKNSNGILMIKGFARGFFHLPDFKLTLFGKTYNFNGGFLMESPAAYPALVGVGFIVGLRVSAVLFSGSLLGWVLLIPAFFMLSSSGADLAVSGGNWIDASMDIWRNQVRPLAVGTMIVAAFYTLYNLRISLTTGIKKAISDIASAKTGTKNVNRLDLDIDFKKIVIAIAILAIPLFFLYNYFSGSLAGSVMLTIVMIILGFLFAAVAGYLVGLVGSSNNPISGLTLSSLLIAAVLLVAIGITGDHGVMAVLGVAGIVCCAAGIAGDMIQDLKVGHILGGTPWRMQVGEIIGVTFAALVLIGAMMLLDNAYHIGSEELPAPQAGLMALMAKGIVGGEMAWSLVVSGMILGVLLILFRAPYPMLIAVGMYLPFNSTFAIFVGGVLKWILTDILRKRNSSNENKMKAENIGVLISSGLIAGEALMAILLGFVFMGLSYYESSFTLPGLIPFEPNLYVGLLVFIGLGYLLIKIPLDKVKE
jgi:putative OPT family oligopeptide transporter